MDPISIAVFALTAIGAMTRAAGDFQAGTYEFEQAKKNRALAEASAADAMLRGEQEASRYRTRGTQVIGEQRAAAGASGIDVSTGSISEMAADTRMFSELDAQTARNNAAREAWGYQVQADEYAEQARMAIRRRNFGLAGNILGGAGDVIRGSVKLER